VRVCIVGAGAIGGLVGARLARSGEHVSVVARGENLDAILRNGLTVVEPDGSHWSATVAAAEGSTITPGQPLPDGVYTPNGSFEYRQGGRVAQFTITTVEPLQYSAECAAGIAAGTTWSPFTAGVVRVAVRNDGNMGFAEVTYLDCNEASVLYVSR